MGNSLGYLKLVHKVGRESESHGKCRLCDSPATIHVTDKSEAGLVERHFCVKHAAEENVIAETIMRSALYPVKHTIVVPLTQDQVERQEVVSVTLPDGSVTQMRFPRDAMDGLTLRIGPKAGAEEKYCINVVVQIVPPPAQS